MRTAPKALMAPFAAMWICLGFAPPVAAQSWTLGGGVGQFAEEALPATSAFGAHLSMIGTDDAGRWLSVGGGGPLAEGGSLWGVLEAGARFGQSSFGLDMHGQGYGYGSGDGGHAGTGGAASLLPFVRFDAGSSSFVEVSSGVAAHVARDGGHGRRTLLHDSHMRASWSPVTNLELAARARLAREKEADHPFMGVLGAWRRGPVTLRGSIGHWLTDDLSGLDWDIGVRLQMTSRLEVSADWTRHAGDPLFRSEPRRGWTLGMSHRRVRSPGARASVVRPASPDNRTEIRIPKLRGQSAVSVAGDFNGWAPEPMAVEGRHWVARIRLPSGVHHLAFVNQNGTWFVPADLPRRDDGMGGEAAVLIIP